MKLLAPVALIAAALTLFFVSVLGWALWLAPLAALALAFVLAVFVMLLSLLWQMRRAQRAIDRIWPPDRVSPYQSPLKRY